jgi:Mor family transcriptional regulator
MKPCQINTSINVSLLPYILQDLVALIGLHATMKLVEHYGGIRLYVPKGEMGDGHELVKLIGREASELLQSEYAGESHFDIPLAMGAMRAVRNANIRTDRQAMSVSETARKYRTTERHIRFICNELEDDRQVGLF